jgi:hypothetical protein
MTARLLITGSRTWADRDGYAERLELLTTALRTALRELCPTRPTPGQEPVLVHGGAGGADLLAADYWEQWGLPTEMHRANWPECDDSCPPDLSCRKVKNRREYCTRAGFRRNAVMVALGADRCIALIHNGSPGATQCADLAEQAGIPTTRIPYPEGQAHG